MPKAVKNNWWVQAKKLKVSPTERWAWYLERAYGLTLKQHQAMIDKQRGACAICKQVKKLHIDHNHKTGKVRGLLCQNCNYSLVGCIEKNIKLAERAISYLRGGER